MEKRRTGIVSSGADQTVLFRLHVGKHASHPSVTQKGFFKWRAPAAGATKSDNEGPIVMGVNIYLLDRRAVEISIENERHTVGTLRPFWKITEINDERAAEMAAAKAELLGRDAPMAVMISDICDVALASDPRRKAAGHIVLGWDADRFSVADFDWEYLPVLGYAVKLSGSANYVLHETRDELLYPMAKERAIELQILDAAGALIRRGQPLISICHSVKSYIKKYVEARCVLRDGRSVEILTELDGAALPDLEWYKGKRPSDVQRYPEAV
jgi:hypothetical protein